MNNVPFHVHELNMAENERKARRLWIVSIFLFLAFLVSNTGWIAYFFWLR